MSDRTYEHLAALRDALPHLDEALIPGTPRRWAERDLTPEQAERMNARAVEEREAKMANLARGIKTLGDGKAPLRLDVLDAMADIAAGVAELEAAVCDVLHINTLRAASTAERISRLVGLLDRIEPFEDLADHVHIEAMRLRRRASQAIGDGETVRTLKFRCIVCDAASMRAFVERELIVCVNDSCRCGDDDCPCHWDRPVRHRWPFSQWPWLADLLSEGIGVAS
jgi:hypothetical protein